MLVFPQLKTGAIAEYPVVRRRRWTSVANVLRDGSQVSYADLTPKANAWDLSLRDLTDAEAEAIQKLFYDVEGRRGTFTFLDPNANLLAHSEELDSGCWDKDPLIQISTGIDDPLGGTAGVRLANGGQIAQTLSQALSAPSWFGYSFSAYARSSSLPAVSLTRSTDSVSHKRIFQLGSGWTRCVLSGALNAAADTVQFTLELLAGAYVDLYGLQVEAQPAASAYKRSTDRNGIYNNARFNDDILNQISDGPDQHRFDVRVVAKD